MSGFEQWLRRPDERDIVPVRGVVMRLAADEIRRLEAECAQLRRQAAQAAAAAEPPAEISFQDGAVTRRLVRVGEGYALPAGAETLDDLLAAQAASAPSANALAATPEPMEAAEEAAVTVEKAEEAEANAPEAAPEETAPDEPDAPADDAATEAATDEAAEEDDEDFELPPEWQ